MGSRINTIGHMAYGILRYATIKDRFGHPRWIWTAALVSCIGAVVATAFAAGVVFRGTRSFDQLKTRIQVALSGEQADPVGLWDRVASDELVFNWRAFETNNKTLERVVLPIGQFAGSGGALFEAGTASDTPIGFVTPKGRVGQILSNGDDAHRRISYLDLRVPMRLDEFEASPLASLPAFNRVWLRTMDAVVRPAGGDTYELYISHHAYRDQCIAFTISRTMLHYEDGALKALDGAWDTVFEAEPCPEMKPTGNLYSGMRDGGRMAWAPDGRLLVTIGDFDFDGDNSYISAPMDPAYDFGKMHLVDADTGESEIFAIGMRNPQGLDVTHDGLVFTSEHGPNGGDEINHVMAGHNYGWPEVTLGMGYGFPRRPWPANAIQGRHDGEDYTAPAYAFVPSIGIGALTEVTSPLFPDWHGDLLVGSLENQGLFRLRRRGDTIIYAERTEIGERIRDMAQLASGQIALLTDSAHIILIRPRPPLDRAVAEAPNQLILAGFSEVRAVAADQAEESARLPIHPGSVVFNSKCASCHAIETREIVAGPHLYQLAGRPIGAVEGYPYSEALTDRRGRWTEERIRKFLSDPDAEFSGTVMGRVALTYPEYLHVAWWITNCTAGRDRPECHTNG